MLAMFAKENQVKRASMNNTRRTTVKTEIFYFSLPSKLSVFGFLSK